MGGGSGAKQKVGKTLGSIAALRKQRILPLQKKLQHSQSQKAGTDALIRVQLQNEETFSRTLLSQVVLLHPGSFKQLRHKSNNFSICTVENEIVNKVEVGFFICFYIHFEFIIPSGAALAALSRKLRGSASFGIRIKVIIGGVVVCRYVQLILVGIRTTTLSQNEHCQRRHRPRCWLLSTNQIKQHLLKIRNHFHITQTLSSSQ